MVFFTCSHCGESVKKPAVAKHYQTKCRNNNPFLTCVDCLKDFVGTEYEAHTKCVTEDERYSAKGYVPKPSQNKGERKQQAWQECIQTLLKKSSLKPDEKELISAISKYENVPRKKAKFINFLTNAFRQYANRKDLIDRVWTEMESIFKEATSANGEQIQQEEKSQNEESQNDLEIQSSKADENNLKKEKKKKRKSEDFLDTSEFGNTDEKVYKKKHKSNQETELNTDAIPDETESKKEKKNKKRKKTEENDLSPTVPNDTILDEEEPEKKKKKKKQDKSVEIDETPAETPETESKSKKKNKKSKSQNIENNTEVKMEETERSAVKKEKKRKKSDNKENCGEKEEVEGEEQEEKSSSKKKKKKEEAGEEVEEDKQETFDWKATILNVLNEDGKNSKMQLQKLQKKVIKRHCKVLNCESSQKKEKKFLKKLKEMPQIEIENDFVVLKS